jgi:DNA polymerase elongation subunit (family B)
MNKPYYSSFFRIGNKVYIRQINPDGTRHNFGVDYRPKLYIVSDNPTGEFRTLDGQELQEIEFSSIKAAKDYTEAYQGKMYGYPRWEYACVDDEYPYDIEYNFDDLRIGYIDIETKADTHYGTIAKPDQPVTLIQMLFKGVFYIFGTDIYESYENNVKYFRCRDEEDMLRKFVLLFRKFDFDIISGWNSQGYDIPYLYSRMNFIDMADTFKKLSPFNMIDTSEVEVFGKMQLRVDIKGIQHLDLIELIKKFDNKKYENFKLDTVANAILKKRKVQYDGKLDDLRITDFPEYVRYGLRDVELLAEIESVKNFIRMVVQVAYLDKTNYNDAFSQVRMWDNRCMTFLKHEYGVQVPFLIAKEDDDFVEEPDKQFEGAYVFEPKANRYEWVMSDDVQSMHPSIIMSFNISPETYLGNSKKNVEFFLKDCDKYTQEIKDNNATSLANGAMFDNTYEGFMPKLVRIVFSMRVEAKNEAKKYKGYIAEIKKNPNYEDSSELKAQVAEYQKQYVNYDTLQNALKVKINAFFGFLGNKFSRFYQLDMAEGITLTSQVMLKSGADEIEKVVREITGTKEDVLLYGDTDSIYYSMKSVVDKFVPKGTAPRDIAIFLDRFHKAKIKQRLHDRLEIVQNRMNAREHSIRFVRDVISDVSILIAKKKYIVSVWDSEGTLYPKQELKVMGVESVKTSTPQYCRNKINESIEKILYSTNNDFINFISNTKNEFMKLSVEEISFPRKINDIGKYTVETETVDHLGDDDDVDTITFGKRCPIHVKASIFHNKLLIDNKMLDWYQPIENGDNIKFTYLKPRNPIGNNTIAFMDKLPKEFKLEKYVDYNMQWEKTFYAPVEKIAKIINWTMEADDALF